MQQYDAAARIFALLVKQSHFRQLFVAEINLIGGLHSILMRLPRLSYSDYGSRRSEDLSRLSYRDGTFDLVLTSDTLEHVPDFNRALGETRRVLKRGGKHIFTAPVIWDRASTLERVAQGLEPSFHGPAGTRWSDRLVHREFGADVVELVERAGFQVQVSRDEVNPTLTTIVATR